MYSPKWSYDYLYNEYTVKEKSTHEIAVEQGTYPNAILKALKYYNIPLRSKSEAQAAALKSGRLKHPTQGTTRTAETKEKISEGVSEAWYTITPVEKERRLKKLRDKWASMSEKDVKELQRKAAKAVRLAAKEGSKIEKFILTELRLAGYEVDFHSRCLTYNDKLEVDLYLPQLKIAIELDGPTHFVDIHGESTLWETMQKDQEKTGLLLSAGLKVLRIKCLCKNVTLLYSRGILSYIIMGIEQLKKGSCVEDRYLQIDGEKCIS